SAPTDTGRSRAADSSRASAACRESARRARPRTAPSPRGPWSSSQALRFDLAAHRAVQSNEGRPSRPRQRETPPAAAPLWIDPVACVLLGLERLDALEGPLEDLGDRPALEARVRVDLRAMVHLVLEHHHEEPPSRQGARPVDHLDPAREPLRRGLAEEGGEAVGRRLEPRQPRPLVGAIDSGLAEDPALAAIRAGEVEPRGADVGDELAEA